MIPWIQRFFHTDKWWGKTIFVVLVYPIFWCVFYGIWFLIPNGWFPQSKNFASFFGYFFKIVLLLVVPILSFFIPYIITKIFKINKIFIYFLHIILIILSLILFFILSISSMLNSL